MTPEEKYNEIATNEHSRGNSAEGCSVPIQDDPSAILRLVDMVYFGDFRDVIPN
jgi:hypothetical protein